MCGDDQNMVMKVLCTKRLMFPDERSLEPKCAGVDRRFEESGWQRIVADYPGPGSPALLGKDLGQRKVDTYVSRPESK